MAQQNLSYKDAEKYKIEATQKKQTLLWGFLAQAICVLNILSVGSMVFDVF